MAKDKDKTAPSSAAGDEQDSDIPLLDAIVVPGNNPRAGKAKLKRKKKVVAKPAAAKTVKTATQDEDESSAEPGSTESEDLSAFDDLDTALDDLDMAHPEANPQTEQTYPSDLVDTLREAFHHNIGEVIAELVEAEAEAVLNKLGPYLGDTLLPKLIEELVKPSIESVRAELRETAHSIEEHSKGHVQNRIQTLEGQLAEFREKLLELTETQRGPVEGISQRVDSFAQRLDELADNGRQTDAAVKQAAADLKRTVDERMALLKDAIERRITQKIADKISVETNDQIDAKLALFANEHTGALQEQLASTVTDLGEMLNDAVSPIDAFGNRLDKLQSELGQLREELKQAQQKLTDNQPYRKEMDALRAERDAILQELEDRFDRAFLRRAAALPKMVANITRAYAGPNAKISVQLDTPARKSKKDKQNQDATASMDKTYNPGSIETRWYETWEKQGYFAPKGDGPGYCIMIPPPNVTGSLHMGHAFQDTIMDALTRYHRMMGYNTLWQAGTDHAGIATQMVVERQLAAQGKSRHDLDREAFIKKVWQWKGESGGMITRQLRRLGASLDWSRERFTMDTGLSKAVREVFVRLYEEGLIYRGKRLVNWDPVLHTAVSDLEVISQEEDGHMWHIRYPLAESDEYIVVATTRPETMLGDAAVAVHPDDERYKHLIGRIIDLPLAHRRIPIVADEYVDPSFGTGCVKITPAHDFNDYQVWTRHRETPLLRLVPFNGLINVFTRDAKIKATRDDDDSLVRATAKDGNGEGAPASGPRGPATFELIPEAYRGLDRFEARKRVVADLEASRLLEKAEKHRLTVPRGDRSGSVIEPLLTDQWFVRAQPLAAPAIAAVETGKIRFVPENWTNTYYDWMRNIQDWCISRQIWWGHRIPAWYDRRGNVYVGRSEAEVRKANDLPSMVPLAQDPDVLDTWFSSALWPFSTLGWPEQTAELKTFYPTNVLVTGFDIIFFWVARMIMMGLKFTGDVPFREVYIHGLVRDAHGQKMSKSKGNVLDPIDLIDGIDAQTLVGKRTAGLMQPDMAPAIEKATRKEFPEGIPSYGTDALRFTFAALASTGRDIRFDLGRTEGYRNFCNKLWNAARYVLMNTENEDTGLRGGDMEFSLADRWIMARLQSAVQNVKDAMGQYRFDVAANAIYEFTWNEYCDWYLELSKPVLQNKRSSAAMLRGTRFTLVNVLETLLRMAHPIIPFITEEIWQKVAPLTGRKGDTIMVQPYPSPDSDLVDDKAVAEMDWVKQFILGVRKIRGEMNIPPGKALNVLLQDSTEDDRRRFDRNEHFVTALAKLSGVEWLDATEQAPESATALVGQLKILIPMAGLIDKEAEKARLGKELDRARNELSRADAKLSNQEFVQRAPAEVIEKERARVKELQQKINSLEEQLTKIEAL